MIVFLWHVFSLFLFLIGWEFRVNSLHNGLETKFLISLLIEHRTNGDFAVALVKVVFTRCIGMDGKSGSEFLYQISISSCTMPEGAVKS